MKAIIFNKKLILNKKTIVNLDSGEMKHALGGATIPITEDVCLTYGKLSCPTRCYTVFPGAPCQGWTC